ncbi:vacuolar protein sorting-associated protein [Pelomyxa schiedti]|nr:vacuolar protein sorting-associated protein [Pelomyxa schiedti]
MDRRVPREILVRCFVWLEDFRDLVALSAVCKSFRTASEDDSLWEKQLNRVFGCDWERQKHTPLKFVFIHTYKTRLRPPSPVGSLSFTVIPELWRNDGAFLSEIPVIKCNTAEIPDSQGIISNVLLENVEDETLSIEELLEKKKVKLLLSDDVSSPAADTSTTTPIVSETNQPSPEASGISRLSTPDATVQQTDNSSTSKPAQPEWPQSKTRKTFINRKQTAIGPQRKLSGSTFLKRAVLPVKPASIALETSETSFQELLELPQCKDIKNAVESFIKTFDKKVRGMTMEAETKVMMNFLASAEYTLHCNSPWKEMPPDLFLMAKMSMKTYLFSHLYNNLFVKKSLQEKDTKLFKHILNLRSVVAPKHLEINSQIDYALVESAVKELEGLDTVITPYEKIVCILNSCKVLLFSLKSSGVAVSADDFLPMFIFMVIQADIPKLASNISFIGRFVDPEERLGEAFCYFTHLASAVTFIESMTPPIPDPAPETPVAPRKDSASPQTFDDNPCNVSSVSPSLPSPASSTTWHPARKMTAYSSPVPRMLSEENSCLPSSSPVQTSSGSEVSSPESEDRNKILQLGITLSQDIISSFAPTFITLSIPVCSIIAVGTGEVWVGTGTGKVIVYQDSTEYVCTIDVHTSPVHALCVDQGNAWCSSDEGALFCIGVASHTVISKVVVHDKLHQTIQLVMTQILEQTSTCVLSVASSSISCHAVQLNSQSGLVTNSIVLPHPVWCAVQRNSVLWLGCNRGCIVLLDSSNLSLQSELHLPTQYTHPIASLACTTNHVWAAVGGLLIAIEVTSGSVVMSTGVIQQEIPTAVCVKVCTDFLFTAHTSGKLACWDKGTGECLHLFNPHKSRGTQPQQTITSGGNTHSHTEDDADIGVRVALLEVVKTSGSTLSLWSTFRTTESEGLVAWR